MRKKLSFAARKLVRIRHRSGTLVENGSKRNLFKDGATSKGINRILEGAFKETIILPEF